ncbi:cyclopropane-fatty-acyl-phospholipid synthase family protein [Phenylobacterium sp.]|uniref:SAM-dependent methyltransferase n=1 Tax=Phenylobacterium sp. TaxID=1871053 RepID=UPI00120CF2DD|nr:cyclopropane-fatty-acyl-phospholipid synthase family protein [Phenylobacterium sp.]THD51753.1 MAG: class I SAM-dependent methyltransferase [Phenylobacterium sp.]
MSLVSTALQAFEGAPLPDAMRRAAIEYLVSGARRQAAAAGPDADAAFARQMAERPIAEHTDAANEQHYEVPAAFFLACLGPRLKYSSCLYGPGDTLAQAEDRALTETCAHADLRDGQTILELGCGWGSLSLWMAEAYPNARITSVSNSASQRAFILARARERGLDNLDVITCDMNDFAPPAPGAYDRVVSVEMFEHMANWRALLGRVKTWLKPEGRLFIHIFTHRTGPYRFDVEDEADWIAQHFFAGGVMPSHNLMRQFPDLFAVEQDWRWSGTHYEKTAAHWLESYDRNVAAIRPVLKAVYGDKAVLWHRRWRLFFLATAGLFGHRGGEEWGISHYRLKPS